jgi:hypothetical protein
MTAVNCLLRYLTCWSSGSRGVGYVEHGLLKYGGDMFPRNVGLSPNCTALQPRILYSSSPTRKLISTRNILFDKSYRLIVIT